MLGLFIIGPGPLYSPFSARFHSAFPRWGKDLRPVRLVEERLPQMGEGLTYGRITQEPPSQMGKDLSRNLSETMLGLSARRGQAKPVLAEPENGYRRQRSVQRKRTKANEDKQSRMNDKKSVSRGKREILGSHSVGLERL